MQKMIYTLILTLLVSSSAYAQGNGNFAGPYIGGSIGYNSFNSDALAENINGITFGAVGGYRQEISEGVYFGGEAYINFSTANKDFVLLGETLETKIKESQGVVAQIGVEAGNDALLFTNAGYGWTRIGAEADVLGTIVSETDSDGGFRLGAGIETTLGNGNGLRPRLEVNWQDFSGASSLGVAAVFLFGF